MKLDETNEFINTFSIKIKNLGNTLLTIEKYINSKDISNIEFNPLIRDIDDIKEDINVAKNIGIKKKEIPEVNQMLTILERLDRMEETIEIIKENIEINPCGLDNLINDSYILNKEQAISYIIKKTPDDAEFMISDLKDLIYCTF